MDSYSFFLSSAIQLHLQKGEKYRELLKSIGLTLAPRLLEYYSILQSDSPEEILDSILLILSKFNKATRYIEQSVDDPTVYFIYESESIFCRSTTLDMYYLSAGIIEGVFKSNYINSEVTTLKKEKIIYIVRIVK